jgi:hypothetical protein
MCNGIYFLWQLYLVENDRPVELPRSASAQPAAGSLLLLSELSPELRTAPQRAESTSMADGDSRVETAPVAEPENSAKEVRDICWQIGPFKEEISGKQVISRLAALDISLQLQRIEIPGQPDYWVHIPPQVTRKAAIKLLRELQAKKIDSFLITEGELENGLSLGFFTQQERAQKIYDQRVEQGYDAKIKIVPRTRTELWAVFDTGEYGKFSDALWDKIKVGNKGLERHKNYCDKIASKDDFD